MGVALAPFFLAADAGGGVPSVLTLVGIALYGLVAWAAVRFAARRAEEALSPRDAVPAADADLKAPAARDGR
jgi:hypothetical protein